jgi:hypothetical protein
VHPSLILVGSQHQHPPEKPDLENSDESVMAPGVALVDLDEAKALAKKETRPNIKAPPELRRVRPHLRVLQQLRDLCHNHCKYVRVTSCSMCNSSVPNDHEWAGRLLT